MPRPYPREFREDAVRVARSRGPGVGVKDIAADFGISESCLTNWMTQADRDEGSRPGPTSDEQAENRKLRRRVTTSWVTKDGHAFAQRHGRMQIIEGENLKYLCREHLGIDVLISLPRKPPRRPDSAR